MKLLAPCFALLSSVSMAARPMQQISISELSTDSAMGRKVMSKARRVEQYGQQYGGNYGNYDFNQAFTNNWVAKYSIKFQGCHHISQWNEEAEDEEDVRILTKRLVRFRLCPSTSCTSGDTAGCGNSYGDYIIDLNSFLEAYFEAKQEEYNDNGGYQYQNAYQQQGNQYQMQGNNQYQQMNQYQMQGNNQEQDDFEMVQNYMECAAANVRRQLQNNYQNNYQNQYQWQQQQQYQGNYYIGPYCASQGGAVHLGLFLDEQCTAFADDNGGTDTYLRLTGEYLPYGSKSIIDSSCISCKEGDEEWYDAQNYNYYEQDEADQDEVLEICEMLYYRAGKCENSLPSGSVYKANNNACNYIEGIKIVRKDGTVMTTKEKANKSARGMLSLLFLAFGGLSAYVYYLKTKLEHSTINLESE